MADERAPSSNGESEAEARKGAPKAPAPPDPAKGRRIRLLIIAGLAVAGIIVLVWWLHARKFEDTDDAQIGGNIVSVIPRVHAPGVAVLVVVNQVVYVGGPLVTPAPPVT